MTGRFARALPWVESATIGALFLGAGALLDRSNPLALGARFPWLLFPVLLSSVRHGLGPALLTLSAMIVVGAVVAPIRAEEHADVIVASIVLVMISGLSTDRWRRGLDEEIRERELASLSLEELSRAHMILDVSHVRLERQLGSRVTSLRDAVGALGQALGALPEEPDARMGAIARSLLSLLSSYCSVEASAVYVVAKDGRLRDKPLATHGRGVTVDPRDPLLELAVGERKLSYKKDAQAAPTSLLVAAPMLDVHDRLHGVVAITAMPFFAFEKQNLSLIGTLAGHAADLVNVEEGHATPLEARLSLFRDRLMRAARDAEFEAHRSTVLELRLLPNAQAQAIVESSLVSELRGLDLPLYLPEPDGGARLLVLLPATTSVGADTLVRRWERACLDKLGASLQTSGAILRMLEVGPAFSFVDLLPGART